MQIILGSLVVFSEGKKDSTNNCKHCKCPFPSALPSSLSTSYLFGDVCCSRGGSKTQLMKGVEAKSVNVAFFCQHHCVVFGCCHLGAVVGHQTLHHPRNLWGEMKKWGWVWAKYYYIYSLCNLFLLPILFCVYLHIFRSIYRATCCSYHLQELIRKGQVVW